jgi:hypothetical protein
VDLRSRFLRARQQAAQLPTKMIGLEESREGRRGGGREGSAMTPVGVGWRAAMEDGNATPPPPVGEGRG